MIGRFLLFVLLTSIVGARYCIGPFCSDDNCVGPFCVSGLTSSQDRNYENKEPGMWAKAFANRVEQPRVSRALDPIFDFERAKVNKIQPLFRW
jgi:hypothetical protein